MRSDELMIECANCGNVVSELETIEDTTWRGKKIKVCKNCYLSNKCAYDYDEDYILEAEMDDIRLERLENENKDEKDN